MTSSIVDGKIVEIDALADPQRLGQPDLAVINDRRARASGGHLLRMRNIAVFVPSQRVRRLGDMSYTITLYCGCVVYVSCHPATGFAHTRVIESRAPRCPVRQHEVGVRLFVSDEMGAGDGTLEGFKDWGLGVSRDQGLGTGRMRDEQ